MYDVELVAKQMRDRALLLEGNPTLVEKKVWGPTLEDAKRAQVERLDQLKKLYFNAGRWAGGARDHNARLAFEKIKERG